MITWQPIETAPKDGTRFLGYRPISEGEWEYEAFAIWWWYENPRVKRSWFTCTDEADAYEVENEPPSHWMPLSEPPESRPLNMYDFCKPGYIKLIDCFDADFGKPKRLDLTKTLCTYKVA